MELYGSGSAVSLQSQKSINVDHIVEHILGEPVSALAFCRMDSE